MNFDFSKLTQRARTCITKASQTTINCRYDGLQPQVMMVSIIQEARDMVFFLLQKMNVDKLAFCQSIASSISSIPRTGNGTAQMSRQLYIALEKSAALASNNGSNVISLEYLFWALCVTSGPVKDIASQYGINDSKLSNAIAAFRNGNIERDPNQHGEEAGNTRNLSKYAQNLSVLAEEGKIEPAIGRDNEIRRVLQILSRKTKNNPILVGAPGTGKTAIVEGLAHRILRGDVPQDLRSLKLYSLDLSSLLAGTSQHGEFEDRLKKVIEEAKSDPNIVLFIDEIHLLIGAGRSSGAMDAANILKPELARGELKVIGATTIDEYTKYVESDKAFERRFQKVHVEEPDVDSAITIMRGIKQRFETFHRIKILDDAIVAAVKLSHRYISERFLPDKAIDLLDEAASRMRIERSSVPVELDELSRLIRSKEMERESLRQDQETHDLTSLDEEIANLRQKENELNAKWQNERRLFDELQAKRDELERLKNQFEQEQLAGNYQVAVSLRSSIDSLSAEIETLTSDIRNTDDNLLKMNLDEDDICQVVTAWTGIPVSRLGEDESERLLHLDEILSSSVIGQSMAVGAVSKVIRRNRLGLGESGKPIGTFLFLGTTGVGKTELAKTLADYLFNSKDMLVRIDMSEYQQEHSVSRLFGAPPGYVGYDQGGQLTEAVRHKPYSVILLDEIEKAHPKVFETLLQVLDDGRMTDGQGRVVDFKNTIIIMTSNMGAEMISRSALSSDATCETVENVKELVLNLIKQRVAPEFINRIDDIVMFMPLGRDEIAKIVALQFSTLKKRWAQTGLDITLDETALSLLVEKGYIPEYGARPVKRAINDYIVNELTLKLLSGELDKTRPVVVSVTGGEFVFHNA